MKQSSAQSGPLKLQSVRDLRLGLKGGGMRKVSPLDPQIVPYQRLGINNPFSIGKFKQMDRRAPWLSATTKYTLRDFGCAVRSLIKICAAIETHAKADLVYETHTVLAINGGNICAGATGKTPSEAIARMLRGNSALVYDATIIVNFDFTYEHTALLLEGQENSSRKMSMLVAPSIDSDSLEAFTKRNHRFVGLTNCALTTVGIQSLPEVYHYTDEESLGVVIIEGPDQRILALHDPTLRMQGKDDLSSTKRTDLVLAAAACRASSHENTLAIVQEGAILAYASGLPDMSRACSEGLAQYRSATGGRTGAVAALSSPGRMWHDILHLDDANIHTIFLTSGSMPYGRPMDLRLELGMTVLWFEQRNEYYTRNQSVQ